VEYQTLFANSERLQIALCNYYATVVGLCEKAVEVGKRSGEYLKGHSASKAFVNADRLITSGLEQFTMALWRPFETEFDSFQAELQRWSEEVKEEISLASRQAAERAG
jgi:hypothetical protein